MFEQMCAIAAERARAKRRNTLPRRKPDRSRSAALTKHLVTQAWLQSITWF
jgi:hypothetical protein